MYTTILVPLDGSAFAERALPVALPLARRSKARVELVHVHPPYIYASGAPMNDAQFDNEEQARIHDRLDRLATRLRATSGLEIVFACLKGPPARTLQQHIASSDADLVVMTTHGRGGLSRVWLGSVADYVVRRCTIPVLLVRERLDAEQGELVFRRILVPLDGSILAETALEHAVVLATPGETELHLLQVESPMPAVREPFEIVIPPRVDALSERQQLHAFEHLQKLCRELQEAGVAARAEVITHRQIARAILAYAHRNDVDLIALATHGSRGVTRLFLGSVADKVLRGAAAPVLMYRPPGTEDSTTGAILDMAAAES